MSIFKRAVIIGGTSGIGLCIAQGLAAQGVKVFTFSNKGGVLTEAQKEELSYSQLDVCDIEAIKEAVENIKKKVGSIDILVVAAGIGWDKRLEDITETEYESIFSVNVKGLIFSTKYFSRIVKRHGIICSISSIAGIKGFAEWSIYSASKHAVEGFVASLRHELRDKKIRLSCIRLGSVDTPFYKALSSREKKDFISPEAVADLIVPTLLTVNTAVVEDMFINNAVGDL